MRVISIQQNFFLKVERLLLLRLSVVRVALVLLFAVGMLASRYTIATELSLETIRRAVAAEREALLNVYIARYDDAVLAEYANAMFHDDL